ncbi:hypothetical protein N866_09095 [Actinotalea ferrariae CF5-4]|uniref:Uncharacterized protein n=1 Tax=Actinotalea ferrariae CF5-4 TaxID=948458 RepID=A0A021VTJ9_9CELL|nr:hypothetical protein [Actinotalea ferrariae]EYR64534.1 hypothetical protein N866_09095 [Actinotalea ferrariae CF5-4]
MSTTTAARPARRLGPGLTAFLVVDVLLVLAFLVVLGTTLAGRDAGAAPEGPAAAPAAPEPETTPEESPGEDSQEVGEVRAFVLPSGNIHCAMDEGSATCTILAFSYERPAPPEGCAGQAGNVLTVDAAGTAGFACQEGEPAAAAEGTPVLEYGEQTTVGAMTCASSTNGVLCRHNESGAGFSVARAGYLFF